MTRKPKEGLEGYCPQKQKTFIKNIVQNIHKKSGNV